MAHLWKPNEAGCWMAIPLDDAPASVAAAPEQRLHVGGDDAFAADGVSLKRFAGSPEAWAVLCPPSSALRVNGEPVPLGLAVLTDRDELRVAGHLARFFFSSETIAHVESFPEDRNRSFCCPRCKLAIEPGSPVVRCPGCGLFHHSSDEMPCWGYASTCAGGCGQDTSSNAGFRWTPEDL